MITDKVSAALDVPKGEDDMFRFIGIDIRKVENVKDSNIQRGHVLASGILQGI